MDHNETWEPVPFPESEPEETTTEVIPQEPEAADTAWHGAGAGQRETILENTPIPEPVPEPVYERTYTPQPEEYTVPRRRKKKSRGRKLLAAILSAVLVVGACAATAGIVNSRWEKRMDEHQAQMKAQLLQLQEEIRALAEKQNSTGVSGSPVSSQGGLSPSQVYAMNVNSVVAISNQSTTNVWGQTSQTASSGTGFIISADGYILSNYHVVEGARRLTVMTYMGQEYEAKLVGYDQMNDVAILKVEATDLDPVTIGSSEELIVGDQVVAIGNPLGELTSSLTVGYISAKDRTINTDGNLINMMQTDAAINPGNSGGPLFNMKGEVIGITTAKYSGSTTSGASIEGIGFAIPIDDVRNMIDDFKNYGYLRNQAYLGVTVMNMDASTAAMYSLPTGSYVQTVVEGGSAHRAGILPQDIIIAVGQYKVDSNTALTSNLRRFSAGDTTTITVFRSGQELVLPITFDERPQNVEVGSTEPTEPNEMPDTGSYEEWYEYFRRYFGNQG